MKKLILALFLSTFSLNGFSKTWTIISSGSTFSPASVTIKQGDSVIFTLQSSHNAVEVSQTVWNANGNTSNNGFSVPFSGGTVLPSKLATGTHYYVCTPHASFGMKGMILVQAATGLDETILESNVSVFPNPVVDQLSVRLNLTKSTILEVKLYDIQGKLINTLLPKTMVSGAFSQTFPFSNEMVQGVYFVRMTIGNNTTYRKVIHL
jgi:plastocyanin